MKFSIIVPVFNRPDEIRELLHSLVQQSYSDFEVLVIEDGSENTSAEVVQHFSSLLHIRYLFQSNSGQGFARNFGMRQAIGDFFVILDSDVLLPAHYLGSLAEAIGIRKLDAFGGPDRSAQNFSKLQKAMDLAMTSLWTTGGIRGKLSNPAKFQARGFNMGVSREVFEQTGGFVDPNRGEDIEWSLRIKKAGFRLELVADAFVYHKRKSTLAGFARQAFSFGENRVNVSRFHPHAIQLVHLLPLCFLLFLLSMPVFFVVLPVLFTLQLICLILWSVGVAADAFMRYKDLAVSFMAWICAVLQLSCYGAGLLSESIIKLSKG